MRWHLCDDPASARDSYGIALHILRTEMKSPGYCLRVKQRMLDAVNVLDASPDDFTLLYDSWDGYNCLTVGLVEQLNGTFPFSALYMTNHVRLRWNSGVKVATRQYREWTLSAVH